MKVKSLSRVQLFVTPWTIASLALLSAEFSRQEYKSGLPFPPPEDPPDPGVEPVILGLLQWQVDSLPLCHSGFPGGSEGKESVCNAGDLGLIPGLGRSPGGGHGHPLQFSCLENPMDGEAW